MTTQRDLQKVWALTGGTLDPDIAVPGKYEDGWVVEIPTYENFNYVLQNHSNNMLVLAEKGTFSYQADISYAAGSEVWESGSKWTAMLPSLDVLPSTDTNDYWTKGAGFGGLPVIPGHGVLIKDVYDKAGGSTWEGQSATLLGQNHALLYFGTESEFEKNFLLGSFKGNLAYKLIDFSEATGLPDSRSLNNPNYSLIYHEDNPPTQTEVVGTIPDAAGSISEDGKMYVRRNGAWVVVTTTVVSIAPPPPVLGAGAGWFNLDDGQFYVDVNDGDSSQWASANPPVIPEVPTYVSSELNLNVGGGVVSSLTHNLPTRPTKISTEYVCQTAELGYVAGDVVTNWGWGGVGVWLENDTQIKVVYPLASPSFINRTGGADSTINKANWNVIVRAWT